MTDTHDQQLFSLQKTGSWNIRDSNYIFPRRRICTHVFVTKIKFFNDST